MQVYLVLGGEVAAGLDVHAGQQDVIALGAVVPAGVRREDGDGQAGGGGETFLVKATLTPGHGPCPAGEAAWAAVLVLVDWTSIVVPMCYLRSCRRDTGLVYFAVRP